MTFKGRFFPRVMSHGEVSAAGVGELVDLCFEVIIRVY